MARRSEARPDTAFSASISKLYESLLVPMIFEPYARHLVARLPETGMSRVLEVAAGTGVVTRALAATLPESVSITATDLNQSMIDEAARVGTARPVEWRTADAMQLPFADAAFDAVLCQFGVMFFPDKAHAFAEARRVLRPGGVFAFSTWDRIEESEFEHTVVTALESVFPDDPPRFLARTPHGYFDAATIERDLAAAGFTARPKIERVTERSRAASPEMAAVALCQGTPMRNEIEMRDASKLEESTAVVANALAQRFGRGPIEGTLRALVVRVTRD
jgi:SAM-dependent methyltransferase